jgi:hypothetical protein
MRNDHAKRAMDDLRLGCGLAAVALVAMSDVFALTFGGGPCIEAIMVLLAGALGSVAAYRSWRVGLVGIGIALLHLVGLIVFMQSTRRTYFGGASTPLLALMAWFPVLIPLSIMTIIGFDEPPKLRRRRQNALCQRCGYPLRGLPTNRCPEGGTVFHGPIPPVGSTDGATDISQRHGKPG